MRRLARRLGIFVASRRTRLKLRSCASVGRGGTVLGRIWLHGGGAVYVGDRVVLDGRSAPIELAAQPGAEIHIGDDVHIDGGASIEAVERIDVGRAAHVGGFAKVMDNHFHAVNEHQRRPPSRPVVIEDGASIGACAILLPGAHVGVNAHVPSGAVLSHRYGVTAPKPTETAPVARVDPDRTPTSGIRWSLFSAISIARATWYLRGCQRGVHVRTTGKVSLDNEGSVRVGDRVVLRGGMLPSRIRCARDASIAIGASTVFNYGVTLDAAESIEIGEHVLVGSLVRVVDRVPGRSGPIRIGDGVWIGHGATILPGVTVGEGSVVSAGSVVGSDVPPRSIAIGSPARCMSLGLWAGGPGRDPALSYA